MTEIGEVGVIVPAQFEGEADFSNAQFGASVAFQGVLFADKVYFTGADIEGVALFSTDEDEKPCHPGSPFSMRLRRSSFRIATALFIAPQNSGSFFQRVSVESSMPTMAATSSSVRPYEIARFGS